MKVERDSFEETCPLSQFAHCESFLRLKVKIYYVLYLHALERIFKHNNVTRFLWNIKLRPHDDKQYCK